MNEYDAYLGKWPLWRHIRGGLWVKRWCWYRCDRRHYEHMAKHRALYSVSQMEDYTGEPNPYHLLGLLAVSCLLVWGVSWML